MVYKRLLRPANWQDFQRMICSLFERKYNMGVSNLYGRDGEAQHGVDIYFKNVPILGGKNVGIQCKRIDKLRKDIIDAEYEKVCNEFPNPIDIFIIVTTDATKTELKDYSYKKMILNAKSYSGKKLNLTFNYMKIFLEVITKNLLF